MFLSVKTENLLPSVISEPRLPDTMQRAELPNYSVNDLRTTFMVENLKNGVDIVLLSQVSGHKRLSTTERYLELAQITEPGKKQVLIEL